MFFISGQRRVHDAVSSIPKSLDGADIIAPRNNFALPLREPMFATFIALVVLSRTLLLKRVALATSLFEQFVGDRR